MTGLYETKKHYDEDGVKPLFPLANHFQSTLSALPQNRIFGLINIIVGDQFRQRYRYHTNLTRYP